MCVKILIIKNQQLFANAIFFTELIMESTLFHKFFFVTIIHIHVCKKTYFWKSTTFYSCIILFYFCWLQNDIISIS